MSNEEPKDRLDPDKAEDPDDYVARRRLKDIYDSRRELMKSRKKASEITIRGGRNSKQKALEFYRKSVENYLIELEPFFFQFGGKEIWFSYDFGTVQVQPPNVDLDSPSSWIDGLHRMDHNGGTVRVSEPLPDPQEVEVKGLSFLFNTSSPITATFEYNTRHELTGKGTVQKANHAYLPTQMLDRMVFVANEFLAEHGLDLDIDQGLPEDELKL